jgi:hypothetical protein
VISPFSLGVAEQRFFGKGLVEVAHDRRDFADGGAVLQYQGWDYTARIDGPIYVRVLFALAQASCFVWARRTDRSVCFLEAYRPVC